MRSKKALINIITNIILQIVVLVYGFIVPKVIINNFGSDVNGLVSSITQFLAYITLLESGFGPVVKAALYKPIAKNNKIEIENILKSSEKFFKSIALIFIAYIIILCLCYPLIITDNFSKITTISLILVISISTFAEYFFGMTYKLYLQAEQKTYIISILQIATYIISTLVVILLALTNQSIIIIKLISGLIFVIRPIIQNVYVKNIYKIKYENVNKNYKINNKWDGLAQHIAAVIHGNTDITILTIFCSLKEVSVYSVYYLVVKGIKSLIQSFSSSIDSTFGDMIARNEQDNLNKKFQIYEILYNIINVIFFSCTLVLVVPFIEIYTKGVTDANYIRYTFGYLIVISEYIWAIRLPYSSITLAAGHFKETRKGAWIECATNILISILLVFKYGIIGVAIGTIVAMLIRTCEFIYHTNKYILKRSVWKSINKIIIIVIETIIIVLVSNKIPLLLNTSYINWILNAIIVFLISCTVTFITNLIIYKNYIGQIKSIFVSIFKRRTK